MKKIHLLPLAVIAFITAVGFAGSLNTAQVPSSSKWVFHVDFDALRAGTFGQLALAEIQTEHQEKLDAARQLFGTDLTKDMNSVTLHGPDKDQTHAAAVFQGKFDQDKLLSLLILNDAYSKSDYDGYTLHHWIDDKQKKDQVGVFAREDTIVIAQSAETVAVALDAINGKTDTLASQPDSSLAQLCQKQENAILTAAATDLSELTKNDQHAAVLKNSKLLAVLVSEDSGNMKLKTRLEADTVESATQIETVLRGMIAFGALSAAENPDAAKLIQAITLTRIDETLELSAQYPSVDLFDLIKNHKNIDVDIDIDL